MSRRPTIADLARQAGVGVATVDRVLNRRHPVREETARRVLRAAEELGYHAKGLIQQRLEEQRPERVFGFLLRQASSEFYRTLAADLVEATTAAAGIRGCPIVEHLADFEPARIAERMRALGQRADVLAVVSVDHPLISQEVARLAERGVPTFALLSDLTAPERAGYVGLDARKAGRTVAWTIARLAKAPGKVGFVVGSHRYLDHDTREMSFRSYFRELAPGFVLLEPLINHENVTMAYDAAIGLFQRHPDIVGLYDAGGGATGTIRALRDAGLGGRVVMVCNALTAESRAGLIDGVVDLVVDDPTKRIARRLVEAMVAHGRPGTAPAPITIHVPFDLYISENV